MHRFGGVNLEDGTRHAIEGTGKLEKTRGGVGGYGGGGLGLGGGGLVALIAGESVVIGVCHF